MICIKVEKNKAQQFVSNYISYIISIFSDGVNLVFELKDNVVGLENYSKIDCSKIKKRMPRLSDVIEGIRSYYLIGDIILISPKRDIDKDLLSQVILKINPKIKSIFIRRKVSTELRINDLEFIGGEYKTETVYKENGLNFLVDITKVYVNPSLSSERLRLSQEINCKGKIFDAFCGYGAISLYLARKCPYTVAGDLNIEGLNMLKKSIVFNKLKGLIDVVQYDAKFLPFRDGVFEIAIADNPTMIVNFKEELCRVSKEVIFYILTENVDKAKELLGGDKWISINDYSKNLRIFKGTVRCDNVK